MTLTQSCTATDCGRPTSLYLCNQCTQDLQAWIDKVPDLYRDLYLTMARLDNTRPPNSGGGKGKVITGSPTPLNLDAYQLRANLASIDRPASQYARNSDGAWAMTQIIDWCTKAEHLISGPEEPPINAVEAAARVRHGIPAEPMRAPDLALWLRTVHQLRVYAYNIRQWAHRQQITTLHNDDGKPRYDPAETLGWARAKALDKRGRTR